MTSDQNQDERRCVGGKRRLVVIAWNLAINFPELLQLARQAGWQFYKDLDVLEIPIGIEAPTKSFPEFVNFLRGLLDELRLNVLRATWLENGRDIKEQLVKLIHAPPLVRLTPHASTLLIDILNRCRIETWFQPIRRADDESVWGYECLIRGRTEVGEVIYPRELIEGARRENLVFMLDRMSRETHLKNAAAKIPDLELTHILINYLPSSVYHPEFCLRSMSAAASAAGIQPKQVVFEVVETESITDMEHLNNVLTHYREEGFQVALDDVGSGFSSLVVLGDLNPDLIKIDISLIQRSRTSKIHCDICESLVKLGHDRNLLVVAEGIETIEDKRFATEIGADLLQGYLLGKPSPEPEA